MSVLAAAAFGDIRALRDDAVALRGRARAAERLAHLVRRTDVGWWSGEASDAFGEALSATARRLLRAADGALDAARALDRHADVVAWARDEASDPTAPSLEREVRVAELCEVVRASAERAADALRAIADGIERLPDGWDVARYMRDQYWTGMGESLLGMVESSWQVQTFRFVTDPLGFAAEQQLVGQAMGEGVRNDPVRLARDMVAWDTWRTEPVRAVGQQVPDLLLSAATAGTGGAAAAGSRAFTSVKAAERAVDDVTSTPQARPRPDPPGTPDRSSVRTTISRQRQDRHVLGTRLYRGGGYFLSAADAQRVLDDFHSGIAEALGMKHGDIVVRADRVTGYNNNPGAQHPDQPTNVFFIKGTTSPSVVPFNPEWTP
ncbi:putative T7SS-secreted protein [Actinotalea solisilvae]|uniref:putative T7SS-secreted protein n=1 Tax=Actinotalea solisilvae TaxID=2072922 RepID=UPI0018F219B3|nr:hypothetical protein [Actinotalea solisilvae]